MSTMMKPLVIYHANCWDGFCAAWVAQGKLGEIEAVPAYYGASPPECDGRNVYILDFSYSRDVMLQLFRRAQTVVVLDHHKTAQSALDGIIDQYISSRMYLANPSDVPTIVFDMNKSGGRLAWEFFYPRAQGSPELVDYTEDRDLWRHALPFTQEINAALRSYPLDFTLWSEFHQRGLEPFVAEGGAIRRAEKAIVDSHVRNARLENFDGTHTVPIVNATVLFSEIAGELAKGHPFAACYFDRKDGKRQWSLRSTDSGVDVSEIAKAHGGGGHAHAAGFEEAITPPDERRASATPEAAVGQR